MKLLATVLLLLGAAFQSHAEMPHEMQHGFILTPDGNFASHLVARGHHSRQTEVTGQLVIENQVDRENYEKRKALNTDGKVYFHLQAQDLDLPSLKDGQILHGHIVESHLGNYEPKNVIVKSAVFKVDKVLLNIPNPFFIEE